MKGPFADEEPYRLKGPYVTTTFPATPFEWAYDPHPTETLPRILRNLGYLSFLYMLGERGPSCRTGESPKGKLSADC